MNATETTIRRAELYDLETIVAFNLAMAGETESRKLDRTTMIGGVRSLLADRRKGVYYVAEQAGKVVGQLMLTTEWSDWRKGWFVWIQSVYVSPESRGSGVYGALHRHVEELCRAAGDVIGLRLYVDRQNKAAQQVYERLGMRETDYLMFETDWSAVPAAQRPAERQLRSDENSATAAQSSGRAAERKKNKVRAATSGREKAAAKAGKIAKKAATRGK
jgi:GNAT superfamily N-acetyltransferase